jgi:hypothetical protein
VKIAVSHLKEKYAGHNIEIELENKQLENLSFIRCQINRSGEDIKIDIMRNIKMLHLPQITHDGIRMIHDLDVASLKLLAAADRGQQKDFYDLYFLSEKHGLDRIYNVLRERHKQFVSGADDNIFNLPTHKPKEDLKKDLSALGNFNKVRDRSASGNRVVFTEDSEIKMSLPVLKDKWILKVKALAKDVDLEFNETEKVIKHRRGLRM